VSGVDPRIVAICAETSLSEQDIADILACDSAPDLALLLKLYVDIGKVPSKSFWQGFADGLAALNAYAPILSVLLAAIPLMLLL
jgi:hypothetical protein